MIDSKTFILEIMKDLGKREATQLRENASEMTGTKIINNERAVPEWNGSKDYSSWPSGSPVSYENQIYTLIQPHNASNYEGNPETLISLWSVVHTTDPLKAKYWASPNGTSGMYMKGECYKSDSGVVYRCLIDNCVYNAEDYSQYWEKVNDIV